MNCTHRDVPVLFLAAVQYQHNPHRVLYPPLTSLSTRLWRHEHL